jgi:hypothetical protein
MKGLGTHIELVRQLGLDSRIRRPEDTVVWHAVRDIAIGSVVGCGIFGVLALGLMAVDRLGR